MKSPNAGLVSAVKATGNCFSVGAIEEELDHLICAEASKLISSSVKMWLHSNFDSPIVRRHCVVIETSAKETFY